MSYFHDIEGVQIPYNRNWKNIGIALSGGADSALLAYLLCDLTRETDTTIHIVNHVRCWKTKPWQQHDADKVFGWLFQRFYHTKFKRHTNFIAPELEYANMGPNLVDEYGKHVSGDNIQQRAYAEYICKSQNIDAYYNAVTKNPLVDLGGMSERDIEPNNNNRHLEYMIHMGVVASHPFRFVDKSWVLKQYKRLDIMDLFNLTRSCEGEIDNINYMTYTKGQEVPICGTCFWCKERAWAIEQH